MDKKKDLVEEDILARVLEAEKEISEKVKAEKEITARWLQGELRAIEAEKTDVARGLEESMRADLEAAGKKAGKKAAAMVEKADGLRRLLSELDDKALKRIVAEQIGRILPGRNHDSQDVEG